LLPQIAEYKARCAGNGPALVKRRTNPPGADLDSRRLARRADSREGVRNAVVGDLGRNPLGLGPFLRWAALQLAHVEQLHFTRCALPATKTAASETALDY